MPPKIHTLVVDDEKNIRFFLKETLESMGYIVSAAENGESALELLRNTSFDLIILDLNLGGKVDGIRVLESAKWRWPQTIVIILTAYGTMDSALAAISEGVDGYLLKPISAKDLRQEVKSALERREKEGGTPLSKKKEIQPPLQYKDLEIDTNLYTVKLAGEILSLTPSEFRLLAHMMKNTKRVISPTELVKIVRDYEISDEKEAREIIKWYIHRLRQKLADDPENPKYIVNIRGIGYILGDPA